MRASRVRRLRPSIPTEMYLPRLRLHSGSMRLERTPERPWGSDTDLEVSSPATLRRPASATARREDSAQGCGLRTHSPGWRVRHRATGRCARIVLATSDPGAELIPNAAQGLPRVLARRPLRSCSYSGSRDSTESGRYVPRNRRTRREAAQIGFLGVSTGRCTPLNPRPTSSGRKKSTLWPSCRSSQDTA